MIFVKTAGESRRAAKLSQILQSIRRLSTVQKIQLIELHGGLGDK